MHFASNPKICFTLVCDAGTKKLTPSENAVGFLVCGLWILDHAFSEHRYGARVSQSGLVGIDQAGRELDGHLADRRPELHDQHDALLHCWNCPVRRIRV